MPQQPSPNQVYRSPEGLPALYVRTEKRPGSDGPEHLFVTVQRRMMMQQWTAEVPDGYELIVDKTARADAEAWRIEVERLDEEVERLTASLQEAVGMLPPDAAAQLRAHYREWCR